MILSILMIIIFFVLVFWGLYLTPQARSTRELNRLNKIIESFNDYKNIKRTEFDLRRYSCKYHLDKVDFIKQVVKVYKKDGNSKNNK